MEKEKIAKWVFGICVVGTIAVLLYMTLGPGPDLQPKAVISSQNDNAYTKCEPGDLIQLSTEGSVGVDLSWVIMPESALSNIYIDSNNTVIFSSNTSSVIQFILIASGQNGEIETDSHTLYNGSDSPQPYNPDVPDVPDGPDGPDGPLPSDLTGAVAESVRQMVTDPNKAQTARLMAGNMEIVVSAINAGVIRTPQDMREQTRYYNVKTIGDKMEYWDDWSQWLAGRLEQMDSDGNLETVNDYKDAWTQIANGLKQVR